MLNHKSLYDRMDEPRPQILSISPMKEGDLHTWVVVIKFPEGLMKKILWQNGSATYGKLRDALLSMFNTRWGWLDPMRSRGQERA